MELDIRAGDVLKVGQSVSLLKYGTLGTQEDYTIDWGDGQIENLKISATAVFQKHTYSHIGRYRIKLMLSDDGVMWQDLAHASSRFMDSKAVMRSLLIGRRTKFSVITGNYNIFAYGGTSRCEGDNLERFSLPIDADQPKMWSIGGRGKGFRCVILPPSTTAFPDTPSGSAQYVSNGDAIAKIILPYGIAGETPKRFFQTKLICPFIVLPPGVTTINNYFLYQMDTYSKVVCLATTPPTLPASSYTAAGHMTLYVPDESLADYQAATNYTAFETIDSISNLIAELRSVET